MSLILNIPDLHGNSSWKKAVKEKPWDKIVFLGDYVDSYDLTDIKILRNLVDIINFKKDNYEKVSLLFGNHELSYLFKHNQNYRCTGFRNSYSEAVYHLLNDNRKLFRSAKQIDNFLFTHAGVNKVWWDTEVLPCRHTLKIQHLPVADQIHIIEQTHFSYVLNDISYFRSRTSIKSHGGIYWADRREWQSEDHMLPGITQIVGHSTVKKVRQGLTKDRKYLNIWFTDCLDKSHQFLYIENGIIKIL